MLLHTVLNNKEEINSDYLGEKIVNLTDSTFQIPISYSYDVVEITDRYIARPDLVSNDIYGDTLYSDLLCKLNGISNPFELNKGMLLIIPSVDCIMDFMKRVSIEESDAIAGQVMNNKPTPKKKTEKRKANEAVIGDTRFKIDKSRGVVIY
jgi:hypothetical protein